MQQPLNRTTVTGVLAAAATIVLWAGAFPAISIALADFEPIALASIRFAAVGAVMAVILLAKTRPSIRLPDVGRAVLCGGLGIAAYNVLLNTGQLTVSASVASFIVGAQPLFAALLAWLLAGERVSARQWIGIAVCLVGVAAIAASKSEAGASAGGVLLVTAAALCSGAFFVLQRPLVMRLGLFNAAPMVVIAGATWLSPWLARGVADAANAAPASLLALAYLAFGAGGLGYLTWAHVLRVFGAARASGALFLMAPTATVIDVALLGAVPTAPALAGGALACLGVAIGTIAIRRPELRRAAPS